MTHPKIKSFEISVKNELEEYSKVYKSLSQVKARLKSNLDDMNLVLPRIKMTDKMREEYLRGIKKITDGLKDELKKFGTEGITEKLRERLDKFKSENKIDEDNKIV